LIGGHLLGIDFRSQAVGATYDNSTKEYISGSILEHCHLEYAGDLAALTLDGSSPFVNHVNISRCKGYGIHIHQVQNSVKILNTNVEYCNFASNQRYFWLIIMCFIQHYIIFRGINIKDANVEIKGCTVKNNGDYGIYITGTWNDISISDSAISDHYNQGMYVEASTNPTMIIKDCIFANNGYYGIQYSSSAGVLHLIGTNITQHYYNGLYAYAASNLRIIDCHFEKTTTDWAMSIYYPYELFISHTTFEDNCKYSI
jgi:parallel beta-helix repeat protein